MNTSSTIQPKPRLTQVRTSSVTRSAVTAILRFWRPGAVKRCQLCSYCTTVENFCQIIVPGVFNVIQVEGLEVITTNQGWQVKPTQPASPLVSIPSAQAIAEPTAAESALDWFRRMMGP